MDRFRESLGGKHGRPDEGRDGHLRRVGPTLAAASSVGGPGFTRVSWTMFAIRMPEPLPGVLIRAKLPMWDAMPRVVNGGLDLGDDECDRYFLVRAEFRPLAMDLLTPANRELLLGFNVWSAARRGGKRSWSNHTTPTNFHLWTAGDSLIGLNPAPLYGKAVEQCMEFMSTFLDNVPAEVWAKADAARRQVARPMAPPVESHRWVPPPPPPPPSSRVV